MSESLDDLLGSLDDPDLFARLGTKKKEPSSSVNPSAPPASETHEAPTSASNSVQPPASAHLPPDTRPASERSSSAEHIPMTDPLSPESRESLHAHEPSRQEDERPPEADTAAQALPPVASTLQSGGSHSVELPFVTVAPQPEAVEFQETSDSSRVTFENRPFGPSEDSPQEAPEVQEPAPHRMQPSVVPASEERSPHSPEALSSPSNGNAMASTPVSRPVVADVWPPKEWNFDGPAAPTSRSAPARLPASEGDEGPPMDEFDMEFDPASDLEANAQTAHTSRSEHEGGQWAEHEFDFDGSDAEDSDSVAPLSAPVFQASPAKPLDESTAAQQPKPLGTANPDPSLALFSARAANAYLTAIAPMMQAGGYLEARHARQAAQSLAAQSLALRLCRIDSAPTLFSSSTPSNEGAASTVDTLFFGEPARGSLCSSLDLAPAQLAFSHAQAALWHMSHASSAQDFALNAQRARQNAEENASILRSQLLAGDVDPSLNRQQRQALQARQRMGLELCDQIADTFSPGKSADALMLAQLEHRPKGLATRVETGFFDSLWAKVSSPLRHALEDASQKKAQKIAHERNEHAPGSPPWLVATKDDAIAALRKAVEAFNRFGLAGLELFAPSVDGAYDLRERIDRVMRAATRACHKMGARSRAFGLSRRLVLSLDAPVLARQSGGPLAWFDAERGTLFCASGVSALDAHLMREWAHALDARSGAALVGPERWAALGRPAASSFTAQKAIELGLDGDTPLHGVPPPKPRGSSRSIDVPQSTSVQGGQEGGDHPDAVAPTQHSTRDSAPPMTAESILSARSDPLDEEINQALRERVTPSLSLIGSWEALVRGAIGGLTEHTQTPFVNAQTLDRIESRAASQTLRPILARALQQNEEPLAKVPTALRSMLMAAGPDACPWLNALSTALAHGGAASFKARLVASKAYLQQLQDQDLSRFPDEDDARGKSGSSGRNGIDRPESLWNRSFSEFKKLRDQLLKSKNRTHQSGVLARAGLTHEDWEATQKAEVRLAKTIAELTRETAQKMIKKSRVLGRPIEHPEKLAKGLLDHAERALDPLAQWALTHTAEGHFTPRPSALFAQATQRAIERATTVHASGQAIASSPLAEPGRHAQALALQAIERLDSKTGLLALAQAPTGSSIAFGPRGRETMRSNLRSICQALNLPVSQVKNSVESVSERAMAMQETLLARFDALRSARALEESRATLLRSNKTRRH